MTDNVPPRRRPNPSAEVDLDADLWSTPPEPPEEPDPIRVGPWLRSVPVRELPADDPPGWPAGEPDPGPAVPPAHRAPGGTIPVLVGPGPDVADEEQDEDEPAPDFRTAERYEIDEPAPPSRRRTRQAEPAPRSRKGRKRAESARRARTSSQASTVPPASRTAARDRLRVEREREARRRRRIRVAVVCAGLAVLAVAGGVTVVLRHQANARDTIIKAGAQYAGPYAPVTVNADNSVTMAQPGVTRPVLDVYEDFQCPPCRAFEKANGGVIEQLADLGQIKVVYHPFTIFNAQPQQASSTRAWAAARCAPAASWVSYHNALFASQPALSANGGFGVSLLVRLGQSAGIKSSAFARCVESQKYAPQDGPLSNQILSSGADGLPTLRLNGQLLTINPMSSALRHKLISASA
jgi:protein-disulfide isomerase